MRVCGVAFSANDAALAILDGGEGGHWSSVAVEPRKVSVADIFDTAAVRNFQALVGAFLGEHAVDVVVIKKRATSGKFAGGAASFRMGGIFQVTTQVPVEFLSPQAIAKVLRDAPVAMPPDLRQYQEEAFHTAYARIAAAR